MFEPKLTAERKVSLLADTRTGPDMGSSSQITLVRSQGTTLPQVRLIWTGQASQQVFGFL
jgi:hypothetical protein